MSQAKTEADPEPAATGGEVEPKNRCTDDDDDLKKDEKAEKKDEEEKKEEFRITLPPALPFCYVGKYVSIGANNSNQIVAVYHHGNISTDMFYSVGKVDLGKEEIKWGPEYKYDQGGYPRVSLNDSGLLVEVHESPHQRKFWCRVGAISSDGSIDWGQVYENGGGTCPSVALSNDDTVVIVHESESRFSYEVFYWFGRVNRIRKTADWICKKQPLWPSARAQELSVAICKQDVLVTFRQGIRGHSLHTLLGKIGDGLIAWKDAKDNYNIDPVSFGSGNWPSISLNSDGTVAVTFQSFIMRALQCREGVLIEKDGVSASIRWSTRNARTYVLGAYPSVVALDGNRIIEMHGTNKLNGSALYYSIGILQTIIADS